MALRQNITIPAGTPVCNLYPVEGPLSESVTLENAYIRVTKIDQGRGDTTIYLEARTADAADHVCELAAEKMTTDRGAGNGAFALAYTHLKTLDRFTGAEDC